MVPSPHPPSDRDSLLESHPIFSILVSENLLDKYFLDQFITYSMSHSLTGTIPLTLTEFYQDYVNFRIIEHMGDAQRSLYLSKVDLRVDETLAALAKIAYRHRVKGKPIYATSVAKRLPKSKTAICREAVNFEFCCFGFLQLDDPERETLKDKWKTLEMTFSERGVEDYLAALHQKRRCLKRRAMTTTARLGAVFMPVISDVWRMTFGLIALEQADKASIARLLKNYNVQKILSHLLVELRRLGAMTSFEVMRLCVESTYESRNVGGLANVLYDFTRNHSLNYTACVQEGTEGEADLAADTHQLKSRVFGEGLTRPRMLYALGAVGFIVGASADVYGLHLSRCALDHSAVRMLVEPIHAISDNNVQVLDLSGNALGVEGIQSLQRFLVKASLLTHLDLADCALGALGARVLAQVFMCMPLHDLRLARNGIGDVGVYYLIGNLQYLWTLEWFDLSENSISDQSMTSLAEALLTALPRLFSLNLAGNRIGNLGAAALSNSLPALPRLSRLSLANNLKEKLLQSIQKGWKVGCRGATSLAAQLPRARSLRYIDVSVNRISASGINALAAASSAAGRATPPPRVFPPSSGDASDSSLAESDDEAVVTVDTSRQVCSIDIELSALTRRARVHSLLMTRDPRPTSTATVPTLPSGSHGTAESSGGVGTGLKAARNSSVPLCEAVAEGNVAARHAGFAGNPRARSTSGIIDKRSMETAWRGWQSGISGIEVPGDGLPNDVEKNKAEVEWSGDWEVLNLIDGTRGPMRAGGRQQAGRLSSGEGSMRRLGPVEKICRSVGHSLAYN